MVYFAMGNVDGWYILQWEMLIDWVWVATWTYRQIGYMVATKKCRRHQTMVASHTAAPLGAAKWLETQPPILTLPLGKGLYQPMSPT